MRVPPPPPPPPPDEPDDEEDEPEEALDDELAVLVREVVEEVNLLVAPRNELELPELDPEETELPPPPELEEDAPDEEDEPPPPPPPPLDMTTVIWPPPPRPPETTTVPPPPRLPRICGEMREADFSAIVTPVSRRVLSIAPVLAGAVRTETMPPPGPPVLGIRLPRWV